MVKSDYVVVPLRPQPEPVYYPPLRAVPPIDSQPVRRCLRTLETIAVAVGVLGFCLVAWLGVFAGVGRLGADEGPRAQTFTPVVTSIVYLPEMRSPVVAGVATVNIPTQQR